MKRLIRKPFRGSHSYEWQIGKYVFQVAHTHRRKGDMPYGIGPKRFNVWCDPYWRM